MSSIKRELLIPFPYPDSKPDLLKLKRGYKHYFYYPPTDSLCYVTEEGIRHTSINFCMNHPIHRIRELRNKYFSNLSFLEVFIVTFHNYEFCDDFVEKAKNVMITMTKYNSLILKVKPPHKRRLRKFLAPIVDNAPLTQ